MFYAAPPPPPPPPAPLALVAPAEREVSFGRVAGRLPRGRWAVVVRVGPRTLAVRNVTGSSFDFVVSLPRHDATVRVTAYRAHGRSARATVEHVYGLPRSARPDPVSSARDERLGATVHELAHSFPGTSGVYVEDNGAANEVESLFGGGSRVDELLRRIGLTDTWMGGGYLRETEGRKPIPSQVDSKPSFGCCKYTTAFDLARLLSWLHLASGGRGPLIAA